MFYRWARIFINLYQIVFVKYFVSWMSKILSSYRVISLSIFSRFLVTNSSIISTYFSMYQDLACSSLMKSFLEALISRSLKVVIHDFTRSESSLLETVL